jgi:hypothetical protein
VSVRSKALAWVKKHPRRADGDSWLGYCQGLMWQLCNAILDAPNPAPLSALQASQEAFKAGKRTDWWNAPAGAFHYWDLPGTKYGHVGLDLSGKGREILMASVHVDKTYGVGVGTVSMTAYWRATKATYLGWSRLNGKNGRVVRTKWGKAVN